MPVLNTCREGMSLSVDCSVPGLKSYDSTHPVVLFRVVEKN